MAGEGDGVSLAKGIREDLSKDAPSELIRSWGSWGALERGVWARVGTCKGYDAGTNFLAGQRRRGLGTHCDCKQGLFAHPPLVP